MKIVVTMDSGDFVGEEEMEPMLAAIEDVAGSHVGHLVRNLTVEVVPRG